MIAFLPVSNETQPRVYALADEANMGVDSLINLALDAYECMSRIGGEDFVFMPPVAFNRFKRVLAEVKAGSHYCEVTA